MSTLQITRALGVLALLAAVVLVVVGDDAAMAVFSAAVGSALLAAQDEKECCSGCWLTRLFRKRKAAPPDPAMDVYGDRGKL